MFPCDRLSPGERLLNGRQPIQPGDRFLAEVINPTSTPLPLVGGTIVKVTPPGKFGRPGRLTLQMTEVVENNDGTSKTVPWLFDTDDPRFSTRAQRKLLTSLMGLGGASVGASLGAPVAGPGFGKPGDGYRRSGYWPDSGTGLRQLPARSGSQPGTGRHLRGGGRHDILPPGAADRADHPLPGTRSLERQGKGQMTRTAMKRGIRDHAHALPVLAILGLAVSGCGQTVTLLETKVLPEPTAPAGATNLPQAYARSQINDPGLHQFAQEFKTWALQQTTGGATPGPLFKRVEVLPPTRTVLPYGVGAFEQELRLPTILTTGPGWASQNPEEKEAVAARAFREAVPGHRSPEARTAAATDADDPDAQRTRACLDERPQRRAEEHPRRRLQPLAAPQPPSSPPPLAPPPPRPVERGKKIHGDEQ